MTNVSSAAAPAQPATQPMTESADPPTMKNAGRLSGGDADPSFAVSGSLAMMAVFLIAVGGMTFAVMVSHGLRARGLAAYAICGLIALVLMIAAVAMTDGLDIGTPGMAAIMALGWTVLGAIAFVVGATVRPTLGPRRKLSTF